MFDALMSGRYDWLLCFLGLVAIALFATAVWLDLGQPNDDLRRQIACEATAMEKPGPIGARMAACQDQVRRRSD